LELVGLMMQPNDFWFEEFFDAIFQFTGILDARGRMMKANRTALKLTGLTQDQVSGQPLWAIPWSALSRQNRQVLKRAVNQAVRGNFVRHELAIRRRGLPEMILDISLKPIIDEAKVLQLIIVEGRDITAYKRTSEALFESEARFKTIFEKAGIGIVIKGVDGKMLDCNPAFQAMLGYSVVELRERDYLEITHALDRGVSRKLFNELVNGRRGSYFIEKRYLHKDGEVIWARITASLVQGLDRQEQYVVGMVENFTAQKQIETELVELQQRLMQGREAERLRLAQELHDGPLQEVIGITYQIQSLDNAISADADREQLQTVQSSLQQLAKSIRTTCGELRPPTLIPFGLEKTILSHAGEFKTSHPELNIELNLVDDSQSLSEPVRIVLFRIYQEALRNIVRHAQANTVWVRFWLTEDQAFLEIQDDGVGFVLPRRWINLARQGHLGLVGTQERAKEVGGNLEVTAAPGQGTLIRAVVPLKEEFIQVHVPGEEEKP
jgi:PAS domain S-box-containing protein